MFSIFAPLRKGGALVAALKNEDRDSLNKETWGKRQENKSSNKFGRLE